MSSNESRPHKNFVELFIEYHAEYESPTSFWKWAAYSLVGSILRSQVYYQHGNMKIFPNTYVVFLADSAQYRKGHPIEVARRLLTVVPHTKVFSGTASIQAVLDLLSMDMPNKNTGSPIRGGAALITADELAAFFVQDPRLNPLLTDLWTCREIYDYHLRSTNTITIKDLCVSMLAASNETFLREVYDSRAVYGGLLGRTFMVKPDETRPGNSLMEESKVYDEKPLVQALQDIRALRGRVSIHKDAVSKYNTWYHNLYNTYKTHPDKTGVIQRMHTQAIKLAIILACADYTLEVTEEVIVKAILEVESLKQNYELYVMSSANSSHSQIGTTFIAELFVAKNYTLTKQQFLSKHWSEIMVEDFDKLVTTLMEGKMVQAAVVGSEVAYKLTPQCIAILEKKK